MRLRWHLVRTKSGRGRLKVSKKSSKTHFWTPSGTLFEATVGKLSMCQKHTIYYVFITLGGSGTPLFITLHECGSYLWQGLIFLRLFWPTGTPLDSLSAPRGSIRAPKATPGTPQNRQKIDAEPIWVPRPAQEVLEVTPPPPYRKRVQNR